MRRRNRRGRRWWRWLLAIGGLLVVLFVAVWFALPTVLEIAVVRMATSAGATDVSLEVERAGFSGLTAHNLAGRFGPVAVELSQLDVQSSLRLLLDGEVSSVVLTGLALTIDGTDPGPEGLGAWIAAIGGNGTEDATTSAGFAWPINRLEIQDAALTLQLPDEIYRASWSASASRSDDGRVAFNLALDQPEQQLRLSGVIDPSEVTGEVRIEDGFFDPSFYQDLAARVGWFAIPDGIEVDAVNVSLRGTAGFERGALASLHGELRLPRLRVQRADLAATVTDLVVDASGESVYSIDVHGTGTIAATNPEQGWSIATSNFEFSRVQNRVTLDLPSVPFSWTDQLHATANVSATMQTNPDHEGSPTISGLIDVVAWDLAGKSWPATSISVEGDVDDLDFAVAELAFPEDIPLALREVAGKISDLSSGEPVIRAGGDLTARGAAAGMLPAGWTIAGGGDPLRFGGVTANVHSQGESILVDAEFVTDPSAPLKVSAPAFNFEPSVSARLDLQDDSIALAATLGLGVIGFSNPKFDPGFRQLEVQVAIPSIAEDSFVSLFSGEVMSDDFSTSLVVLSKDSRSSLESTSHLHYAGATQSWSGEKKSTVSIPHGSAGVTSFSDVSISESSTVAGIRHDDLLQTSGRPFGSLARELIANSTLDLTWSASALELPGETQMQWLSGTVTKEAAGTADLVTTAQAGILRSGPETLEQTAIEFTTGGSIDALDVAGKLTALLEGNELNVEYRETLAIDWPALTLASDGSFELAPYTFINSDVLSRWLPETPGLALSGTLAASGTTSYSAAHGFDGTLDARLNQTTLSYPKQRLRIGGIEARVRFDSLAHLTTGPGQELRFAEAQARDFALRDGLARFRLAGPKRLYVEETSVGIFDGMVSTGPFSLFFPDPDVAVVFLINSIDASQLVRQFDLFKGSLTGRLSGRLPVALLAGRPLIGQGFLELDQGTPSTLKIDAEGLFTGGLPNRTLGDKITRLGNELAEEGLENLSIQNLHVDLFRPEYPGTPVRIDLSGVSDTPRAHVPMNIVTNVNGSVAEVIDFIAQFLLH